MLRSVVINIPIPRGHFYSAGLTTAYCCNEEIWLVESRQESRNKYNYYFLEKEEIAGLDLRYITDTTAGVSDFETAPRIPGTPSTDLSMCKHKQLHWN